MLKTHNIKTDYKRTKLYEESWIQVAQIRVQKQSLLITELNPQIPLKVRNFNSQVTDILREDL
jgi:hypothetical protein